MTATYQRKARLAILAVAAAIIAIVIYAQATLREDDSVPPGPPEVAGRKLMESKRCLRCHRISGFGGLVGPDLTVVALRRDEAFMRAYLADPRAVNPKGKMPKPHLTPEQRAAVVAYLRTLDGRGPAAPAQAR
jgi:mono/diheme cytochrome c family protein